MKNLNIVIREPRNSSEFNEYYNLRWKILRQPLGQEIDLIKDELENKSYHLVALLDERNIIGVGRLHSLNNKKSQIRYMAISKKYQKLSVGKKILKGLELRAKIDNKKYIVLHARESALNFYINNGYKIVKKSHLLLGEIQHYLMIKKILYKNNE